MSADDDNFDIPWWLLDPLINPREPPRTRRSTVPPKVLNQIGRPRELLEPLPPVDETPGVQDRPCPPNMVRDQFGGCSFIPTVVDPDTGEPRYCSTDDECENPERHRKCPPGKFWNGKRCESPWSPNPFISGLINVTTPALLKRLAQAALGELGAPAPKRSPGPSRRRPPRRRAPPPKRPPARPRRPAPGQPRTPRVVPGPLIPGMPADMPSPTLNPIDFIIREWQLYTRPLGERSGMRRRGGARTRARFPPMPPVVLPTPGPIPVELPHAVPRVPPVRPEPVVQSVPAPARSPSSAPRAAPARRVGPVTNPLVNLALSLLSPLVSPPPNQNFLPRQQPRQQARLRQLNPQRQPIGDPLTPLQPQQLGSLTVAEPTNDPCAVRARDARRKQRRRRQQCKKFTTKTIRVCAERR